MISRIALLQHSFTPFGHNVTLVSHATAQRAARIDCKSLMEHCCTPNSTLTPDHTVLSAWPADSKTCQLCTYNTLTPEEFRINHPS